MIRRTGHRKQPHPERLCRGRHREPSHSGQPRIRCHPPHSLLRSRARLHPPPPMNRLLRHRDHRGSRSRRRRRHSTSWPSWSPRKLWQPRSPRCSVSIERFVSSRAFLSTKHQSRARSIVQLASACAKLVRSLNRHARGTHHRHWKCPAPQGSGPSAGPRDGRIDRVPFASPKKGAMLAE